MILGCEALLFDQHLAVAIGEAAGSGGSATDRELSARVGGARRCGGLAPGVENLLVDEDRRRLGRKGERRLESADLKGLPIGARLDPGEIGGNAVVAGELVHEFFWTAPIATHEVADPPCGSWIPATPGSTRTRTKRVWLVQS